MDAPPSAGHAGVAGGSITINGRAARTTTTTAMPAMTIIGVGDPGAPVEESVPALPPTTYPRTDVLAVMTFNWPALVVSSRVHGLFRSGAT